MALFVQASGVSLIDGADVMRAFSNDKADVGLGVRRADPGAVKPMLTFFVTHGTSGMVSIT